METNHDIIALLRLLADSLERPDPCSSPLTDIAALGGQAVPLLVEALNHGDPIIRRTAAEAIELLRSPVDNGLDLQPALPHLGRMLDTDTDSLVRLHAAEALHFVTGTKTVVPAIIEALSHGDVEVRCCAVSLLGLVQADLSGVLQPLVGALADPNPYVRATAATALSDYGQDAAEALPYLEGLLDDDEFTRVTAVHAILCIESSRAEDLAPRLAEALASRDAAVRQSAAQVVGEILVAGALAVSSLIERLHDDDEIVRAAVLSALERLGPRAAPAIQALVGIVRDNNDIIERGFATDVLAAIGPVAGEAVPELAKCIEEPGDGAARTFFRLKVASALWHVSGQSDRLLAIGNEAAHDSEWWIRHKATVCLGEVGPAAVPDLRQLSQDEHPIVRRAASESLQKIDAAY